MIHAFFALKGAQRCFARTWSVAAGLVLASHLLPAQNVSFNTNSIPLLGGSGNTGIGLGVLAVNAGNGNIGIGSQALQSNASGYYNIGIGNLAINANTSGWSNIALGNEALRANTTGGNNVAVGDQALRSKTTGNFNTAVGSGTLAGGTYAAYCTAVGAYTMQGASGATFNTAIGYAALLSATGSYNTALGSNTLAATTAGTDNTAAGHNALTANQIGSQNSAFGSMALSGNTSGKRNCAFGWEALLSTSVGERNVGVGAQALTTNQIGSQNTALGYLANVNMPNYNNATALGNNALANNNNKVRIGSSTVTAIEGQVAYTFPSDGRFKTNVRAEDVVGLDFIQKLRPVVYNFDTRRFTEFLTQGMPDSLRAHYLSDDFGPSTAIRQSGFIAQEVEQAAREAGYDFDGVRVPSHASDNYALSYSQFVVPLVKAVQEQQAMIATQAAQIALQQKELAELKSLVRSLAQAGEGDASKQAQAVEVFPNPSAGRFTLRIAPLDQGHWEVYDQQGKQVHFRAITPGQSEYSLDLSGLASGSYLLRLHSPGGLVATKQLVVK